MLQGRPQSLSPLRWVAASPSPAPVAHGARGPPAHPLTRPSGQCQCASCFPPCEQTQLLSVRLASSCSSCEGGGGGGGFSHDTNIDSGRFYSAVV